MMYDECFEFLRYSLVKDYPIPVNIRSIDWQGLYEFGCRQSLLGVLFAGVKKLPADVAPPQKLLMQWFATSDKIRKENIRTNNIAVDVFRRFSSDGFCCCLLKGQGNNLMYDDPYSRTSGDIDMWMCGYRDATVDSGHVYPGIKKMRDRTVDYVERNFQMEDVIYYHTSFNYKGIEVETHFSPSMMANPLYDRRFQKWCRQMAKEQSDHFVKLPDTESGSIPAPTIYFNLVYQLDHIYRHFFDMGIGLRQMIDYYYLLMRYNGKVQDKEVLRKNLKRLGLLRIAGAVMWVLQKTLRLQENKMIAGPDERRGKLLLSEILNGGNFGKFDKKYGGITRKGTAKKFYTKTVRNLSFAMYYPEEALCEPFFRIYHFFWRRAHGWK